MDTSSISSMVTRLLQQHVSGQTQEPGQQEGMKEKAQELYNLVKGKLSGHPESAATLQSFEQAPDQHAGKMQNVLNDHLSRDPGFLAQITEHLRGIMPGAAMEGGKPGESLMEKAEGFIGGLGQKKEEGGEKAA